MPYDDTALIKLVNDHGYLLQQAVEHTVLGRSQDLARWRVVSTEHYWQHPTGVKIGYADLLIGSDHGFLGVVECKRVREDTPWIFLSPRERKQADAPPARRASSLHWVYRDGEHNSYGWANFFHKPTTPSSQFCIVVGQSNDRPMLERVAGDLLYAAEAIGQQQLELADAGSGATMFLPIIVTNANLYSCSYGLDSIDSINGKVLPDDAQMTSVPFIRFEKVFTETPWDARRLHRLQDIEPHQRQTVMVVNSAHVNQFMDECRHVRPVGYDGIAQWPWIRDLH